MPVTNGGRKRRRGPVGAVNPVLTWSLLMPYLVLLIAFGILPVLSALVSSLGLLDDRDPAGLATYRRALSNLNFLPAVLNVSTFLLIFLPVLLSLATGVALTLHARAGRFASLMRLAYYLPGVVVGAPLVLLWLFMLTPDLSPFGGLLRGAGLETAADVFTSSHMPVIFAVMATYSAVGGWIVVLYGALEAVDSSVLEAARIDGAGPLQTAWYVKLPLIKSYVAFIGVISFAGAAQLVVEPSVVGQALPGSVSQNWSINQLAFYYAFNQNDGGAASVYAMVLVSIGLLAAVILIFGLKSYTGEREA